MLRAGVVPGKVGKVFLRRALGFLERACLVPAHDLTAFLVTYETVEDEGTAAAVVHDFGDVESARDVGARKARGNESASALQRAFGEDTRMLSARGC